MKTTYAELLNEGKEQLERAGIKEADLDAWYLLSEALSLTREHYLMDRNIPREMVDESIGCYEKAIQKRAKRIPLQHIIGIQEFMGLPFRVDRRVLIPRQDTETLVEEVLKDKGRRVLDVCTGSGCIAVSLSLLGGFLVDALDVSADALEVAKENAERLNVDVTFCQSDLFEAIENKYDVIVSNPPYIPDTVIKTLEPEVRDYEPYIALYGPENGLYFYKRISKKAKEYLNPGGRIYYEIGCEQADDVVCILENYGYDKIEVIKDLAGKNRVVKAVRK